MSCYWLSYDFSPRLIFKNLPVCIIEISKNRLRKKKKKRRKKSLTKENYSNHSFLVELQFKLFVFDDYFLLNIVNFYMEYFCFEWKRVVFRMKENNLFIGVFFTFQLLFQESHARGLYHQGLSWHMEVWTGNSFCFYNPIIVKKKSIFLSFPMAINWRCECKWLWTSSGKILVH